EDRRELERSLEEAPKQPSLVAVPQRPATVAATASAQRRPCSSPIRLLFGQLLQSWSSSLCGWPFPNPHPSAKHRRAHKKICGTIEGYKLCSSEEQSRSNGSDDGHGSDDDKKSPGPEVLNIGNKEKDDSGIGDKINRSEDEVFSDAVADFSDSQGVKESLQEGSLDSSTSVEWDGKDDPKFSGSSKDSDFN
ncbi:hypothetical protein HN873_029191, partial [Arachis hypogaea]